MTASSGSGVEQATLGAELMYGLGAPEHVDLLVQHPRDLVRAAVLAHSQVDETAARAQADEAVRLADDDVLDGHGGATDDGVPVHHGLGERPVRGSGARDGRCQQGSSHEHRSLR
jgi:hypothetical protein